MRTFVIGDIHGQHRALCACLKSSGFDRENDRLIALGDVCDRGGAVREAIDELLKIRNLTYIIGNHDVMALDWAVRGRSDWNWLIQGGQRTRGSYGGEAMPPSHIDLLQGGRWWLEDNRRLFVHGGFDPERPILGQDPQALIWDRELVNLARIRHAHSGGPVSRLYQDIFIGHTPTIIFNEEVPIHVSNVWMMDTGAGYRRKLTIMDVETKEFWQAAAVD